MQYSLKYTLPYKVLEMTGNMGPQIIKSNVIV